MVGERAGASSSLAETKQESSLKLPPPTAAETPTTDAIAQRSRFGARISAFAFRRSHFGARISALSFRRPRFGARLLSEVGCEDEGVGKVGSHKDGARPLQLFVVGDRGRQCPMHPPLHSVLKVPVLRRGKPALARLGWLMWG